MPGQPKHSATGAMIDLNADERQTRNRNHNARALAHNSLYNYFKYQLNALVRVADGRPIDDFPATARDIGNLSGLNSLAILIFSGRH